MDKARSARLKRELKHIQQKQGKGRTNVNFKLLFLVLVVLVSFVVFAFLFRSQYEELSSGYGEQHSRVITMTNKYQECVDAESSSQGQLSEILANLNISQQRETALGEQYVNVTNVKQQLATDLSNTQDNLITCQGDLATKASQLYQALDDVKVCDALYNRKAQELSVASARVTTLESDKVDLEGMVAGFEEQIDDIENCLYNNNLTEDCTHLL
jgi:chromosome segregation ATPase